jgi:hypothetical protein
MTPFHRTVDKEGQGAHRYSPMHPCSLLFSFGHPLLFYLSLYLSTLKTKLELISHFKGGGKNYKKRYSAKNSMAVFLKGRRIKKVGVELGAIGVS